MPSLSSTLSAVSSKHPAFWVRTIDPSLFRDKLQRNDIGRPSHSVVTGILNTDYAELILQTYRPIAQTAPIWPTKNHCNLHISSPRSSRFTYTTSTDIFVQPSLRVLQTLRFSYLSRMIAATRYADEYWHLFTSDCRNTLIYAHTTSRVNIICAWNRRLCGLNPAINFTLNHNGAHLQRTNTQEEGRCAYLQNSMEQAVLQKPTVALLVRTFPPFKEPVLRYHVHKRQHCITPYACLTLRRLTSYIYGAPILDVSRSHTTTQHSR